MDKKKIGNKIDVQHLKELGPQLRLLPLAAREPQVFDFLRSAAQLFEVRLTGTDRADWRAAKANLQAIQFAEEMGYMLAKDLPALIKPMLSEAVDYLTFEDWWLRAVPTFLVIDPAAPDCETLCRWVNEASNHGIWSCEQS
jgi:hypothetical protein